MDDHSEAEEGEILQDRLDLDTMLVWLLQPGSSIAECEPSPLYPGFGPDTPALYTLHGAWRPSAEYHPFDTAGPSRAGATC